MPVFDLASVIARLRSRPPIEPGADRARAAVAAILREGGGGGPELLLIERAEHAGDPWSGHLAFPGGKREPGDPSLLATAARETREEIGLELDPAACLARLDDVMARRRSYRVAEFVFAIRDAQPRLALNAEVTATLWVPLSHLASSEAQTTFAPSTGGEPFETPCLRVGSRVLWGMTYRMAQQIVEAIEAPGR